jgi:hypothetical protein
MNCRHVTPIQINDFCWFWLFSLWEFQLSNPASFSATIFRSETSVDTCHFRCVVTFSFMSLVFGNLNSQTLATFDWLSSRVEDLLTCILPNQWFFSYFKTLASSTISTVVQLPPQSMMINIFFGTSELLPSAFLQSALYPEF